MDIMETECSQEFVSMIHQAIQPIILDFGCGGGLRLFKFLEKCKNLGAVGIDISISHLMGASKDADERKLRNRVDFVLGDVNFPPFRDNVFSHVLIVDVLYILPSLNAMSELPRVVNQEGYLFIVEKIFNPTIARSLYRIVNKPPIKHIINKSICSFRGDYRITKDLLKQRLLEVKFEIVKEEHVTYLPTGDSHSFPLPLNYVLRVLNWIYRRLVKYPIANRVSIGIAFLCKNCAE